MTETALHRKIAFLKLQVGLLLRRDTGETDYPTFQSPAAEKNVVHRYRWAQHLRVNTRFAGANQELLKTERR